MNFSEHITLDSYAQSAENEYTTINDRLVQIDNNYKERMQGKTAGSAAGSLVGTIIWIAVFSLFFIFFSDINAAITDWSASLIMPDVPIVEDAPVDIVPDVNEVPVIEDPAITDPNVIPPDPNMVSLTYPSDTQGITYLAEFDQPPAVEDNPIVDEAIVEDPAVIDPSLDPALIDPVIDDPQVTPDPYNQVLDPMLVILILAEIVIGLLLLFMLIDNIIKYKHYSKISKYESSISELINRIFTGKKMIRANTDTFMSARNNGWNYALAVAPSIPNEAASIEQTMANVEALKKGGIYSAKKTFYYASVCFMAVIGCMLLFPVMNDLVYFLVGDLGEDPNEILNGDVLLGWDWFALVVTFIFTLIISHIAYIKSKNDVNNITVLMTWFAPAVFIPIIFLGTIIIMLLIGILSAILAIIAVVVIGAIGVAIIGGLISGA